MPADSEPTWTVDLPQEWRTAPPAMIDLIATGKLAGGDALLVSMLLADGTNIMAVTWPGGQRLVRMGLPINWAVQEHYDGELPADEGAAVVERLWCVAVRALVQGKADTIADLPDVAAKLGLKARSS